MQCGSRAKFRFDVSCARTMAVRITAYDPNCLSLAAAPSRDRRATRAPRGRHWRRLPLENRSPYAEPGFVDPRPRDLLTEIAGTEARRRLCDRPPSQLGSANSGSYMRTWVRTTATFGSRVRSLENERNRFVQGCKCDNQRTPSMHQPDLGSPQRPESHGQTLWSGHCSQSAPSTTFNFMPTDAR